MPGVVDAWYLLLDRWGTMSFEQVLQPAIETGREGFPLGERLARAIAATRKIRKYPTSMKVYLPDGAAPKRGRDLQEPRSRAHAAEAGRGGEGERRARAATKR